MSTPKAQRQPLSDKRKLIIIITAIVLAAVIAVSATLIVLLQPKVVTPDANDPSNNPSSSLPVKNGDFGIVGSEETTFPKSATNWTKYTYKDGDSHDFEAIEVSNNVIMGIVDTDEKQWDLVTEQVKSELTKSGADASKYALTNPGQHSFLGKNEKHSNSNVYMIATAKPTNAAIISDSVSVSATTSVKITVRYNSSQISEGEAVIMIQNSSSTPNGKEENRYAYDYHITKKDGDWNEVSFYVFNRKTSTQYVRVSVGLGNIYTGENAQGVMYFDDIVYETVTANDYREKADKAPEGDTTYKIIEKEEETTTPTVSEYLKLKDLNATTEKAPDFTRSEDKDGQKGYASSTVTADDAKGYSPFTDKDDFFKIEGEGEDAHEVATGFGIYKLVNAGDNQKPVALELANPFSLKLDENNYEVQDYNHVSFWVRTVTKNDNALAYANVLVQRKTADGWESLDNGEFTAKTEQNFKTDTNNGWNKYDIYLKPAKTETEIRIVFALGNFKGYEGTDYFPEGELYVTTPYFETISSSAYTSASSSTASKKFDLTGSTAETSVTNGSFSSVSANTQQPTGWTPAFAGQNIIYRDGRGDITVGTDLSKDKSAIEGSGTVNWREELPSDKYVDDDEGKILKLTSNATSSFGYVSSEITASAKTVYVFSVLAKVGAGSTTARPYFYLLQPGQKDVERDAMILAEVNNFYEETPDGLVFCQGDDVVYKDSGWTRYYIVYVTGAKDTTVRLALFNGSIDGTSPAAAGTTIYYDKVTMQTIGTYAMVEDEENEDAEEYIDKFTAGTGFADTAIIGKCENVNELVTALEKVLHTETANSDSIKQPAKEEWDEMRKIPEPDDDEEEEDPTSPTQKAEVNLALLFSILSSVLLVAALAVVIVIKIYRQRRGRA